MMQYRCLRSSRWLRSLLVAVIAAGLGAGIHERVDADEGAWEAVGPEGLEVARLYTPSSGALFAAAHATRFEPLALFRSNDGGQTWSPVHHPPDAPILTVSPVNHDVLYAAGEGGVFHSADGGVNWQRISDYASEWVKIEVSPADPTTLYGHAISRPPADYGSNVWHELLLSQDAGVTWEVVRRQREHIVPGTQPCAYAVRTLQPLGVDPHGVLTIEGCTGRGMDPLSGVSLDEGRTVVLFPGLGHEWAASGAVGGRGANPNRWYATVFQAGIPYTRVLHSKLLRSDDGANWKTLLESDSGVPNTNATDPVDFISTLAYNSERPDEVYVRIEHFEPELPGAAAAQRRLTGVTIGASRDGGETWSSLGAPEEQIFDLALGIDGAYLFAATADGVHRIALHP